MTRAAPVSVTIPVYDGERYLRDAMDSVLGQTRPPAEVLIVDDGSTDGSTAIARAYGPPVRVITQPNAGTAAALNTGIRAATQAFFAFLDHDDVWLPQKLERQLAALDAEPAPDLVFCHMQQFISPELPAAVARRLICDGRVQASPLISGLLARRDAFVRVGLMDPGSASPFVDWSLRARDSGLRSHCVPMLLCRRRIHGANTSLRMSRVRRDYLRHIKSSLDRRRRGAARGNGGA